MGAVFESYWEEADFEPYDPAHFAIAVRRDRTEGERLVPSPTESRRYPVGARPLARTELPRGRGWPRTGRVAATGTGKTVMAAVDYQRLRDRLRRARLLFVAHREEILTQSRATFAHALRDANFGEEWVGGRRPAEFEHVFASIQSLRASGVELIDPT